MQINQFMEAAEEIGAAICHGDPAVPVLAEPPLPGMICEATPTGNVVHFNFSNEDGYLGNFNGLFRPGALPAMENVHIEIMSDHNSRVLRSRFLVHFLGQLYRNNLEYVATGRLVAKNTFFRSLGFYHLDARTNLQEEMMRGHSAFSLSQEAAALPIEGTRAVIDFNDCHKPFGRLGLPRPTLSRR